MKSQKKKYIYIIRHGETAFNTDPQPRVRGRIEVPLNAKGMAHALGAGDFLKNENLGKVYYSKINRAKKTAELVAQQHATKLELIEEPLIIDISWGDYEGKTYKENFGDENGGDYIFHPEKLPIPNGETFYGVMDRMRKFFIKFWESDEEVCTIVSHGTISNLIACMIMGGDINHFWTMYMAACGVSKIVMYDIYDIRIDFWNAKHYLKEAEEKYLEKMKKELGEK